MSTAVAPDPGAALAVRPLRVIPASWDRERAEFRFRRPVLWEVFRAEHRAAHAAEVETERRRRARLDWAAYIPDDEPGDQPADEPGVVSAGSGADPAVEPGVGAVPDAPDAPDALPLPLPSRSVVDRVVEVRAARWADPVASVTRLVEPGVMPVFPSASEYRTWSDDRIARLRVDPEEVPDGAPFDGVGPGGGFGGADPSWYDDLDDDDGSVDAHPVNRAVEEVEAAQAALRRAEAVRVQAAVSAWRVAEASVTGTAGAMVNGPFFKSVMLQLAFSLQVAEQTAAGLVHAAMELEARVPVTWARFVAGDVPWRAMLLVRTAIDGLDQAHWAVFDAKAADAVVSVAVPRVKQRLHEIRERIQAATGPERHARARKRMNVTVEPLPDGMAAVTAVLPAPEAVQIVRALDTAAETAAHADGETRGIGELRAHILIDVLDEGLFRGTTPTPDATPDADTGAGTEGENGAEVGGLAVPGRRGVQCKVGLLIPVMTVLGHSDVPPILEGYGPIDIETAKRLAGTASSWVKVLTDPVTGAVIDLGREKYRPTDDMRALLGVLDRGSRGPNTTRPPSQTETDHITPFRQHLARGRTALDNLVLLTRREHAVKTAGYWDIELRNNRDLVWTSFFGTRIITTVQPLEPTPIPTPSLPPHHPHGTTDPTDWADPDTPDELDCPF